MKMRTNARMIFSSAPHIKLMKKRNVVMARPIPQITGSARGNLILSLVLRIAPQGTPIIPAIIVITPKTNATLEKNKI